MPSGCQWSRSRRSRSRSSMGRARLRVGHDPETCQPRLRPGTRMAGHHDAMSSRSRETATGTTGWQPGRATCKQGQVRYVPAQSRPPRRIVPSPAAYEPKASPRSLAVAGATRSQVYRIVTRNVASEVARPCGSHGPRLRPSNEPDLTEFFGMFKSRAIMMRPGARGKRKKRLRAKR